MEAVFTPYSFSDPLHITALYSIFRYRSPKNFCFPGEAHDFWEFVFADQGQVVVTAGEQKYILRPGELVFHRPGEFHAVETWNNTPASFVVVSFRCESPEMHYFEGRILPMGTQERDILSEALRCARSAFGTNQQPFSVRPIRLLPDAPAFADETVRLRLELLLLLLRQHGDAPRIQARIESYSNENRQRQLTASVTAYLEEHLRDNITLEQIGGELGYSVSLMKKRFRAETGRSIMDTFIDLKMAEAVRLLHEGSMSVTEVAYRLGYSTASYFSCLFKKRTGSTPSECARSVE